MRLARRGRVGPVAPGVAPRALAGVFGVVRDGARNPVAHDAGAVYLSHLVAGGIGFAVGLIVARQLGPTEFAVITAYTLIIDVLAGFTDFGLGTGLIKFATPLLAAGDRRASAYFRAALYAEIVAGLLVLVVGLSFSGLLTEIVGRDLPHKAVVIATIAAAITSAGAYIAAAQAAHKLFKRTAVWQSTVSAVRLLVVLALVWTDNLSLYNVLYAYAVVAFLGTIAGFLITPRDYAERVDQGEVRVAGGAIFRFSGWLTLTFFLTSVMGRLDFFFLYKLRGGTEAGVYAAAMQLSLAVSMMIAALTTVLTPHASERTTYAAKIDFLRRLMPAVALLGGLLVASSLTFPFVIELLFGDKYSDAAAPLTVLIVHLALNILLIPISLLFIPLGKIRVGTFISVLQLGIAVVLYPILIDAHGAVGAALTVLVNTSLAFVIYVLVLRRYLRMEREAERYAAA